MNKQYSTKQQRLAALVRATKGMIRVQDAMNVLGLDRSHASKLLAGWHNQGAIRRVARGLYVPIQVSALGQEQVLEDPWVLVPELYEPGYVGGWSALEYWDLTEQVFRSVCVLTSKRTAYGEATHQGVSFYIKHIPPKNLIGTKTLWRGNTKVQISDPCKTILDIVDDLRLGAGLQHTVDCLKAFRKLEAGPGNLDTLLKYAIQINNGALFKKLGFLFEKLHFQQSLIDECRERLTTGFAHLDKEAKKQKLITRWRLWVPADFDE